MTLEEKNPDLDQLSDSDEPAFAQESKDIDVDSRLDNVENDVAGIKEVVQNFQTDTSNQLEKILKCLLSIRQSGKGEKAVDESANFRNAWMATTDLMSGQKDRALDQLKREQDQRGVTEKLNGQLQESVQELQKESVQLQEQVAQIEKDRDHWKHEKELLDQELEDKGKKSTKKKEFPSNETIIHNLLTSQVEFYFSDHHLKRDKPLMEKLCTTDNGKQGFIPFDEVCNFPKVRTLGQDKDVIKRAVQASKYLEIKEVNGRMVIGRSQFSPPAPQQFPFRRTVFVYGVPLGKDELWIRNQFECFGVITKVKFDSGPHSCPRKVGARLLQKEDTRVIRLHIRDSKHTEFIFKKAHGADMTTYICGECQRMKKFTEGYYMSTDANIPVHMPYMFCIQCAAKKAEENLKFYQQRTQAHYENPQQFRDLFGIDQKMYSEQEADLGRFITCLIVFESQRQASKCVYVRSRLGIEGCFATHFHNFTRHKREICAPEGDSMLMPPMMKEQSSFTLKRIPMKSLKSTPIMSHSQSDRNNNFALKRMPMKHQNSNPSGSLHKKSWRKQPQQGLGDLRPPPMRRGQSAPTYYRT